MSDATKREQIVEEINVTSAQDLELKSEKTEPLRYTANTSLPQMDILIPTESVIQNYASSTPREGAIDVKINISKRE